MHQALSWSGGACIGELFILKLPRGLRIALVANDFSACRVKIWRLAEQLYGNGSVDLFMVNPIQMQRGLMAERCHRWTAAHTDLLAKELKSFNVIHLFCDATAAVASLLTHLKGRSVVLHRHDIASMRGIDDPTEPWVMNHPNTEVVITSPDHGQWLQKIAPEKTLTFIPNAPLKSEMRRLSKRPRRRGIMYYGGLVASPGTQDSGTGYRFYWPQWRELCRANIDVHIFPKRTKQNAIAHFYRQLPGCIVHQPVAADELVSVIAQFEVSFIGYNDIGVDPVRHDYAMSCWPNKAFDPVASQTPLLGYKAGSSEAVWKGHWGVATDSLDDLVEGYRSARRLKPDWSRLQKEYCLDQFADRLVSLYNRVAI